jgi:hypothetical protein
MEIEEELPAYTIKQDPLNREIPVIKNKDMIS